MHEMSLVEDILSTVLELAAHEGKGRPVERVVLRVGELQQIVPELLVFAFEAASADTLAAGAELELLTEAAVIRCDACGHVYTPEDIYWECPACQAIGGEALSGEDMIIERIVLDEGNAHGD